MKEQYRNKVVVVTGASAGIGRAICMEFAKKGAHLALISRNEKRLASLQNDLQQYGIKTITFPLDVADATAIGNAAAGIESRLGAIDIWINNAMVSVFSPIKEMSAAEYKRVTEVTYLGYVYGTLAALNYMLPRDKGMIIQVGSALAYRGIPLQSAYCAAKHAVQGFHDSLLSELIHDKSNVRTTMVQLSAHNTPQFNWVRSRLPNKAQPVPPIYQPEVAARAVVWAAQHYRREWVIGFPAFKAIYGNNFFPAFGDRYLARQGYKSQQTNEVRPADQPDNLFNSVDADIAAHGRFNDRTVQHDIFFEISKFVRVSHLAVAFIVVLIILLILL